MDGPIGAWVAGPGSKLAKVPQSSTHGPTTYVHQQGRQRRGRISLRYTGAMRHLAIERAHQGKYLIMLIAGPEVMIANIMTGKILAEHTIDRYKSYQAKKKQKPQPEGGSFCQ